MKPSIGRIVIYVPEAISEEANNGATEVPAIVVRAWGPEAGYQNNECNLKIFTDGVNDTWRTSVPYSEEPLPRTWHWPARV